MVKNLSAIVLAGGKSTRMGTEKGLVLLNGQSFVQHILNAINGLSDDVFIVANNPLYDENHKNVVKDLFPNSGPLAGIYTGMQKIKHEMALVLSCDIPLIDTKLLKWLIENEGKTSATILSVQGQMHPLIGIYKRSLIEEIRMRIENKQFKMIDFVNEINGTILYPEINMKGFELDWVKNFNYPKDLL